MYLDVILNSGYKTHFIFCQFKYFSRLYIHNISGLLLKNSEQKEHKTNTIVKNMFHGITLGELATHETIAVNCSLLCRHKCIRKHQIQHKVATGNDPG